MKKTFPLTSPKKQPERHVDAVKHEIKKYLGRERRKKLPEGSGRWEFDCKIGPTQADSQSVRVSEINAQIDKLVEQKLESFYVEILARAGVKPPKSSTDKATPSD